MGSIIRYIKSTMDLEEIKTDLRSIQRSLETKVNNLDCLMFGSVLRNSRMANDVDILIIYKDENQIPIIKQEFQSLEKVYPLHLNYFTFEEEKELNFITEQKAEYLFRL